MKNSSDKIHLLEAKLADLDSKQQLKQRRQIAKIKEQILSILTQTSHSAALWNLFLTCFPKATHFNYGLKILQISAQNPHTLRILNQIFHKSWNQQIYINVGLTNEQSKLLNAHILQLCMKDQLQFKNYVLKAVPQSRQICDRFISSLYQYFNDKVVSIGQKNNKNSICTQTILQFLIKVCKQSDKFSDDAIRYALQTIFIIYKEYQDISPIVPKFWKEILKKILAEQRCTGIIYQIIARYLHNFLDKQNSQAQVTQVTRIVNDCQSFLKNRFNLQSQDNLKTERFCLKSAESDKYELSEKFLIGAAAYIEAVEIFYLHFQSEKFITFKNYVNFLINYQNQQIFIYCMSTMSTYKNATNKSLFQLLDLNEQQFILLLIQNMPNFEDKKILVCAKQIIRQVLGQVFTNGKENLLKTGILKAIQIVQDYQFDEYQFVNICQAVINIHQWLKPESKEFLLDFLKILLNYNDSFEGKVQDKIISARNLIVNKILDIVSYYPMLFANGQFLKKVYGEKLAQRFPKTRQLIDRAIKNKILDHQFCKKLQTTIRQGYQDPFQNFQKKQLSSLEKIEAWTKIFAVQKYLNTEMIQQDNASIQRVDNDAFLEFLYKDIAGFKIMKGNWNRIVDKKYLLQFQRIMGQYELQYEMELNQARQLSKYD